MIGIIPFEPTQVGPGLGIGANVKAGGEGLNNEMMGRELWILLH